MNYKRKMNEKGIMSYMVGLVFILVFLLMLWAFILPMIQQVQVETFVGQQSILADTNEAIQLLPAGVAKTALQNTFNTEIDSTTTNYDIIAFFIQYWWIFLVLIVSMGTYLLTRRNVEFQGGF